MDSETYYKYKTMVKNCNHVLQIKCEFCRSNKTCREYNALLKADKEKEEEKEQHD